MCWIECVSEILFASLILTEATLFAFLIVLTESHLPFVLNMQSPRKRLLQTPPAQLRQNPPRSCTKRKFGETDLVSSPSIHRFNMTTKQDLEGGDQSFDVFQDLMAPSRGLTLAQLLQRRKSIRRQDQIPRTTAFRPQVCPCTQVKVLPQSILWCLPCELDFLFT